MLVVGEAVQEGTAQFCATSTARSDRDCSCQEGPLLSSGAEIASDFPAQGHRIWTLQALLTIRDSLTRI